MFRSENEDFLVWPVPDIDMFDLVAALWEVTGIYFLTFRMPTGALPYPRDLAISSLMPYLVLWCSCWYVISLFQLFSSADCLYAQAELMRSPIVWCLSVCLPFCKFWRAKSGWWDFKSIHLKGLALTYYKIRSQRPTFMGQSSLFQCILMRKR